MKIHEYQAKNIFFRYGIPVPEEILCRTSEEVLDSIKKIGLPVVLKAQVLTGGRGKAGGVKVVKALYDALNESQRILGMDIKGYKVEKLLVSEAVKIKKEYYYGLTIDRKTKSVVLMASAEGGVEIEEVAKVNPEAIFKFSIDSDLGMTPFLARKIAFKLFDDYDLVKQAVEIFQKTYKLFIETDASLVEINPLVITNDGKMIALDGKINFDDNALFRQKEIEKLNEPDEEEKKELEAKELGLTYIKLDGNIGCMVNGAGLAMATMDLIKYYGGQPANFLDIGGSSNPKKVIDAMEILVSDKKVKAVMINIFGGITRCDDVARGLVSALKQVNVKVPIVVRLSGTKAEEGLAIINEANLLVVNNMSEAAIEAIRLSKTVQ